MSIDLG